jgi:hypothetical protein
LAPEIQRGTILRLRARRAEWALGLLALAYGIWVAATAVELSVPAIIGASLLFLLLQVVATAAFCHWFYLAVALASIIGVESKATPAAAVGSWFIPLVNLAWPFSITRRLLMKGDAALVLAWQATWIHGCAAQFCAVLLAAAQSNLNTKYAGADGVLPAVTAFSTSVNVLLLTAALFGAAVVARTTGKLSRASGRTRSTLGEPR